LSDYLKNIAHSIQNKSGDISKLQQEAKKMLAYAKENNHHTSAAFKEHKKNMLLKSIGNKYDKIHITPEEDEEVSRFISHTHMVGVNYLKLVFHPRRIYRNFCSHFTYTIPIVPVYTPQFPVKDNAPNFTEEQRKKADEDMSNFNLGIFKMVDSKKVFLSVPMYFSKLEKYPPPSYSDEYLHLPTNYEGG